MKHRRSMLVMLYTCLGQRVFHILIFIYTRTYIRDIFILFEISNLFSLSWVQTKMAKKDFYNCGKCYIKTLRHPLHFVPYYHRLFVVKIFTLFPNIHYSRVNNHILCLNLLCEDVLLSAVVNCSSDLVRSDDGAIIQRAYLYAVGSTQYLYGANRQNCIFLLLVAYNYYTINYTGKLRFLFIYLFFLLPDKYTRQKVSSCICI